MIGGQALPKSERGVITGRHVLIAILSFFVLVTGVNGIMIYKALTTFGGVETEDAYRKGLAYNQRIAADEAQAALGWQDELSYSAPDRTLALALKDRDGKPVSGAHITATVGRSATNRFDQTLAMSEKSDGHYQAAAVPLEPGAWIVDVMISRPASAGKDAAYAIRRRLWLKP